MQTVFFSWQSDANPQINKNFIEKAIKRAIKEVRSEAELLKADREELNIELDKDTMGVSGSPPIMETIFKKIDECCIFVPDLTYIGRGKRALPNPNVMIEYGWALKKHSHEKIVAVMNTAYGDPKKTELPFDIKHTRWPIQYFLKDNATTDEKKTALDSLTRSFKIAFSSILKKTKGIIEKVEFEPMKPPDIVSCFLRNDEELGHLRARFLTDKPLYLDRRFHLYLRLFPKFAVEKLKSPVEASNFCNKIEPLCESIPGGGYSFGNNIHGAFSVFAIEDKALSISQLLMSKEIWGIDTFILNPSLLNESEPIEKRRRIVNVDDLKVPVDRALRSYLKLYLDILKIQLPYKIIIGINGIKGFAYQESGLDFVSYPNCGGNYYVNNVSHEFEMIDTIYPSESLNEFYDLVAEYAGITPLRKRQNNGH